MELPAWWGRLLLASSGSKGSKNWPDPVRGCSQFLRNAGYHYSWRLVSEDLNFQNEKIFTVFAAETRSYDINFYKKLNK
jgi:hypothetical protein